MAALWLANDKSTKEIMVFFYDYLQQGCDKDVALQLAQKKYLQQKSANEASPSTMNPDQWSHLVVIGDTASLKLEPRSNFFSGTVSLGLCALLGLLIGLFIFLRRRTGKTVQK